MFSLTKLIQVTRYSRMESEKMTMIIVLAISLIVICCVYKNKKSNFLKITMRILAFGLIFSLCWIVFWGLMFKNENLDSRVIETVKSFDWTDKEKLTFLGIEYKSYEKEDGSFSIHIADTREDEYFYVYIYSGSNDINQTKDPNMTIDGDFAYYCNIETNLNYLLIPELKEYYYHFEMKDAEVYVFGNCKAFSQNNFDNFVLEKLK